MNAVNLLPPDLRRGSAAPTRSGIGVYVLLGALTVAVVLVAVTAVLHSRVSDRESDLAQAEAEAAAAEQQASAVSHYKQLAADTGTRVASVRKVADGRVAWSSALTEVSRTIGTEVRFSGLGATIAPTVSSGGASNPLRAAVNQPALEIQGCARDHAAVARLIARFRAMNDVTRVSLSQSDKGSADGATAEGSCTDGGRLNAQFNVVIFLEGPEVPAATTTTTSTGGAG